MLLYWSNLKRFCRNSVYKLTRKLDYTTKELVIKQTKKYKAKKKVGKEAPNNPKVY